MNSRGGSFSATSDPCRDKLLGQYRVSRDFATMLECKLLSCSVNPNLVCSGIHRYVH